MKQIQLKEDPKGVFHCDLDISIDEWKDILMNDGITKEDYKDALIALYNAPNHRASCKAMAEKNGGDADRYNSRIDCFCKAVVERNDFQISGTDGKECFWPVVAAAGRNNEDGNFEWTMRPELVSAIDQLGWVNRFTWIPFYKEFANKLMQFKDNRKPLVDLVYASGAADYIKASDGGKETDIDPFTVFGIFNRKRTDDNRLQIISFFKEKLNINASVPEDFSGIPILNNMKSTFYNREETDTAIQPLWDFFVATMENDEQRFRKSFDAVIQQRGIKWNLTMGLFWIRPNDYIALDSNNREYLPKIGFKTFGEKDLNAENYLNLLNDIKTKINNGEINENNMLEISYNAWAGTSNTRNYWLVGYSYGGVDSQFDRFIREGIWEGGFGDNSKSDQKLLPIVKTLKEGDVLLLKSTGTKGAEHNLPFMRVKAVGIISGDIEVVDKEDGVTCTCSVEYKDTEPHDFDGSHFGSFRKTLHKLDLAKEPELQSFINEILNEVKSSESMTKYDKYIKLLKSNHNIVLTGAPGTGKTFMAHEIARAMGCSEKEVDFVQFHPSYDYTDFVEGLRPIDNDNGQIGFERRDGVFKEFCAKALENDLLSAKSKEQQEKELTWTEKLNRFIRDSIDKQTKYALVNGGSFYLTEVKDNAVYAINENNEKTKSLKINLSHILDLLNNNVQLNSVGDIRVYSQRKFGTQQDSYEFVITQKVRQMPDRAIFDASKIVPRKNFVFIIDEINRGEASKIFGELFFAIDPGYRGDSSKSVKTQYQNLVEDGDIYKKGFYIPKNVYIIGTMNDIDRSVESMDFAMRRRFTWIEVKPTDTEDMLDCLSADQAIEAKKRMHSLNKAISGAAEYGLGDAFQIGGAYFKKLGNYDGDFNLLWNLHIEPLLKEYLRGTRYMDKAMKTFKEAYDYKPATENTEEKQDAGDDNA